MERVSDKRLDELKHMPCDFSLDEVSDIAAELQQLRGWVSVKDRLPETDDRVWAWNSSTELGEPSNFDGARFIDESGSKVDLTDVVTHWRELPAAPSTEESQ